MKSIQKIPFLSIGIFLLLISSIQVKAGGPFSLITVDTPVRTSGCTGTYTITLNASGNFTYEMNAGSAVTLTFNASSGIDPTTYTGGTHNGAAIVGAVTTATTITYNTPGFVNDGTNFTIVLNGITHGTNVTAGNISVDIVARFGANNTGTTNNYTTGASSLTVNAGNDQYICSGTTATMAANAPGGGETGTWTWVSGTGSGTITTPNSETSTITSLVAGTNIYKWTISDGGSCSASEEITIIQGPLVANAGSNQELCTDNGTMDATLISGVTGAWSLISGAGSITTPSSNISTITALGDGINTFRWTISKTGCASATDDIDINRTYCLNLKAPSFDTINSGAHVVSPWTSCGLCCSGGGCSVVPSPDTQNSGGPGGPSDGSSCVGLAANESIDGGEAISQKLITPMVAGKTYNLTIDVAYSTAGGFFTADNPQLVILGASDYCQWSEILYTTDVTTTASWTTKNVSFTPTYNNNFIILRAKDTGSDGNACYIYVDNMTNIDTSGTTQPKAANTSLNQCAAILPIELLSFNANCKTNNTILNWETSSEINNDYFTIERSSDAINFEEIDRIQGAGNSNNIITYSLTDENTLNKTNYYRLKQTDYDGKFAYSEIIASNCRKDDFSFYPNPIYDNLYLDLENLNITDYDKIIVTNSLGKIVKKVIFIDNKIPTSINLSDFRKGIYYIQLIGNDKSTITKKLVKA